MTQTEVKRVFVSFLQSTYCINFGILITSLRFQVTAGVKDSWLKSTLLDWAMKSKVADLQRYLKNYKKNVFSNKPKYSDCIICFESIRMARVKKQDQ